jgi:hypothetical protein
LIAPSQLLGKTFEECEKILGKPSAVENPEGDRRSFARSYKLSTPGLAQVKIERVPQGSMTGKVSETVNWIWYYFPKGKTKTLGEAFTLLGIPTEGAMIGRAMSKDRKPEDQKTWDTPLTESDSTSVFDVQNQFSAIWTSSAKSLERPLEYRNPEHDTLSFQPKLVGQPSTSPTTDILLPYSTWAGEPPDSELVLVVTQRFGEHFVGKFSKGRNIRNVTGPIKDGKITWHGMQSKNNQTGEYTMPPTNSKTMEGYPPGGHIQGTIVGDTINCAWRTDEGESGTFTLRRKEPGTK